MSTDNNSYVNFVDVQKSYDGETLVIKSLNLAIERQEFITMLGPSGSGKTTILMMLAGFEPATHGEIILDGEPINNVAPHKRNIGMVFQNYALFPHMTVAENLSFPLEVRKIPKNERGERIKKALEMVQLSGFENRRPLQLSGGQQQRVAVARALVFDPRLVLMDEPLGALDKNLREQMQYEIRHIHESLGVTVVYVTHDQSEALTMSNRIAVFNDGVVQQVASPEALYEFPDNAFVAQFIGENNKLSGIVKQVNKGTCSVEIGEGEIKGMIEALAVNIKGNNCKTMLSLRPERIFINPSEGSCQNIFDSTIEELIYLGDHVRTRVNLLGHDDFIIKIPNTQNYQRLQVGETVKVGWNTNDCRALDHL
jgi:putative spermidine/putrescine transport system ATP-binding protein